MRMPRLAGLGNLQTAHVHDYAPPTGNAYGNNLPANTGIWEPPGYQPGPGPYSGPGYRPAGGNGGNDAFFGADPRARKIPVHFAVPQPGWQECLGGEAPGGRGLTGFNDQRRVVDRHAYWDHGSQKTGLAFNPAAAFPNAYNNPLQEPPLPNLRTVNRTVSWQIGSDNSANQDDLARPYTRNAQGMYVGEQGSGWAPVYGGTPGLYQPYGSRGGYPMPIVAPVEMGKPGDGPQKVFSGPPHGLHSLSLRDRALTMNRYLVNPQMRPVRVDRPSNSPQAGQSYSQTVVPQGGQAAGANTRQLRHVASANRLPNRGWKGTPG